MEGSMEKGRSMPPLPALPSFAESVESGVPSDKKQTPPPPPYQPRRSRLRREPLDQKTIVIYAAFISLFFLTLFTFGVAAYMFVFSQKM